jgi:outer membrane lipoprotein-sorting protein
MTRYSDRSDELLSRAVAALATTPGDEGPSAEALRATISAVRAEEERRRSDVGRTATCLPWKYRAAVVCGTLAATVVLVLVLLVPRGRSFAFEQAVEKLRAAERLSFIVEQRSGDPVRPPTRTRVWLMEPDKSRTEWLTPQGKTEIIRSGDKFVQLNAASKTAVVGELPPGTQGSEREALANLRSAVRKDARSLGEKDLDGVRAQGFEAVIKGRKITLWADARTGDPLRIEYPLTEIPPSHGPALQVLSEFKFDEPFDAKRFSLDVPPGHRVVKFRPVAQLPIDHMAAILRHFAARNDGEFPPRFDDQGRSVRAQLGLAQQAEEMSAERKELAEHLDGLARFLNAAQPGRDFQYYPGARLGEKDRVVFWCVDPPITGTFIPLIPRPEARLQLRRRESKYVVLYGDLRIEKVSKLPQPPEVSKPRTPE